MQNNQKIPEGWSVKKLGDVVSKISRRNIINNTNVVTISAQKGFINQEQFFNKSVAGSDLTNYYLLEKGDFGYNRSYSKGYPTGAIKRVDNYDYATVSTLYICFRPLNKVNSDYLLQYFETGLQHFELYKIVQEGARNHGLLNVSLSDFFNIKLLLPPLAEQEKIAGILGTWDEAIEKLSSLIEQKKLLKKGLMQRLLTGKTRLKGFTQPWKEVKLGDICKMFSGGTPLVSEEKYYKNGNIPFIRSGEISSFKTELFITEKALENSSAKMIEKGDLLYALYGATSGETAISKINGAINQAILCIRSTKIEILYLYYVLLNNKSIILSKYLQGGQGNLSADIVKKLSIKMPSDIAEQKAVADVLSTTDEEIDLLNKKLEALKEQKKGLMQQLLTGQIRVKVN